MVTILPPKTNLGSAIGQQFGQGIQSGFQSRFEDQKREAEDLRQRSNLQDALLNAEKVYDNPNLSVEQKQFGLQKALSAHPEIMKQSISLLQQQQQKQQQENALRAIENQRGLQPGSLAGLEGHPSVATNLTRPQKPSGGITSQPVPPQISQEANKILEQFPEANADQLKMKMDQAGIPPIYSNGFVENRRRQDETKAATREKRVEAGNKRAEKVLEAADKIRETIPSKEASLFAMEDAIQNGDLSFFSFDNLAEMTGLEGFRTAKGGQFKSASKNFFINTLSRVGARANQFLEKQIADGLPKIGRTQAGNLIGAELARFDIDVEKKRLETIDRISDEYEQTLGYVPGSFGKEVDKSLKQYVEERQEQLANRLKFLNEQESSEKSKKSSQSKQPILMRAPDGSELMVPEDEMEEAIKLGAKRV